MFIDPPDNITDEMLEGTNYRMVDGQLRYFYPNFKGRKGVRENGIPAVWLECERCGKIRPAVPYNNGKYCTTKCAYEDRKGERHVNWTGGRSVNARGYVRVNIPGKGRLFEHRHVMEEMLGRSLHAYEHVHHINGNTSDNRPENLELWIVKSKTHPNGVRLADYIVDKFRTQPEIQALDEETRQRVIEALKRVSE